MTDDDAKALVAYLRTVPAVDNVVPRTKDLKMPKMTGPKPANLPDEGGVKIALWQRCHRAYPTSAKSVMATVPQPIPNAGKTRDIGKGTYYHRFIRGASTHLSATSLPEIPDRCPEAITNQARCTASVTTRSCSKK